MKAKLIKTEFGFRVDDLKGILIGSTLPSAKTKLSLKNCQTIERGYDLDDLAKKEYPIGEAWNDEQALIRMLAFKKGFQKALELMGDKKFSEENLLKAFTIGVFSEFEKANYTKEYDEFLKSLQQKEWDVKVKMGGYRLNDDGEIIGFPSYELPKLDADGCLILKRI